MHVTTHLPRVIAIILLVDLLGSCSTPVIVNKPAEQLSSQADSKELDLMLANAKLQNQAALKHFDDSLAKLEASYDQRFDLVANSVANKASETDVFAWTVFYLAKDSVRNKDETNNYLNMTIGPIINPVVDSYAGDVQVLANNFDNELRNISKEFASKLHSTGNINTPGAFKGSQSINSWAEFDKVLHNLGYTSSKLVFQNVIRTRDLVNLNFPQLLKPIASRSLEPLIKQVIATTSATLSTIEIAPISMTLGAVSIVWNAYDAKQLQPRYREEVLISTKGKLTSIRASINVKAKAYANDTKNLLDNLQVEMRSHAVI